MNSAVIALGLDVGGTKCAAGVVALPEGRVIARRVQPTAPERGGETVLAAAIDLALAVREEAVRQGCTPASIGIGVPELVDKVGRVVSDATLGWQHLPVVDRFRAATALPARIEADVRAAARAEADLGAGRGLDCFLYVTVGTGISAALVVEGRPHLGGRGLTGTFASSPGLIPDADGRLVSGPPLEQFAAGPALAVRLAALQPEFRGGTPDILALADRGEGPARTVVASAGRALGAAVAHLVNVLDPAAVVVGGGLGLAGGLYQESMEQAVRQFIWSDAHRDLELRPARLGPDAGWVGAALAGAA